VPGQREFARHGVRSIAASDDRYIQFAHRQSFHRQRELYPISEGIIVEQLPDAKQTLEQNLSACYFDLVSVCSL
jgi:hypothetical protein